MNSNTKGLGRKGSLAASVALLVALAPVGARAETPSGADLLLPKPAEFIPALIAFLVIWLLMAKLVWPQVLGTLERRQQKIKDDLDAAAHAREEAERGARSYEERMAQATKEAEAIVARAKKEAEEERARILAKAQRESADIIAKAHGAVGSERKKAMIELSGQVVDLSVEIASKIIGNHLSVDEQRRLAEQYLEEVSVHDGR